jgi:hypothetical protein
LVALGAETNTAKFIVRNIMALFAIAGLRSYCHQCRRQSVTFRFGTFQQMKHNAQGAFFSDTGEFGYFAYRFFNQFGRKIHKIV